VATVRRGGSRSPATPANVSSRCSTDDAAGRRLPRNDNAGDDWSTQAHVTSDMKPLAKREENVTAVYGSLGQRYGSLGQRYGSLGQRYSSQGRRYGSLGQRHGSQGQRYGSLSFISIRVST
jgi:hypothetical protein